VRDIPAPIAFVEIYTYLGIRRLLRSLSEGKSARVDFGWFSSDNQSPR